METIGRWTWPATKSTSALVPVHVIDASSSPTRPLPEMPTVMMAGGLRIEGLFEQIAMLVERLG